MDAAEGIYETDDSGFVTAIQRCISDVCDSMAWVQTAMARNFTDANGRETYDDTRPEAYQKFFFDLNRLYRYCAEILPDDLNEEIKGYLSKEKLTDIPESKRVDTGIELANKIQEHVHWLGLKNTVVDFDIFDFECYLS